LAYRFELAKSLRLSFLRVEVAKGLFIVRKVNGRHSANVKLFPAIKRLRHYGFIFTVLTDDFEQCMVLTDDLTT